LEQKTQLSLAELTVLVVSDLQGHPKSMISILSDKAGHFVLVINSNRFRYNSQFSAENAHFYPPFNPKFENVSHAPNR